VLGLVLVDHDLQVAHHRQEVLAGDERGHAVALERALHELRLEQVSGLVDGDHQATLTESRAKLNARSARGRGGRFR
jgi:hypothetical protein